MGLVSKAGFMVEEFRTKRWFGLTKNSRRYETFLTGATEWEKLKTKYKCGLYEVKINKPLWRIWLAHRINKT